MFVGLLDSKTVVYITHQVEFLPAADLILVSHSHLVSFCLFLFELKLMDRVSTANYLELNLL